MKRKYLHKFKTRHGKVIYYVRVRDSARIRLPDDFGSAEFWDAYKRALEFGIAKAVPKAPTATDKRISMTDACVRSLVQAAKLRAKKSGRAFDIDTAWVAGTIKAQGYTCALTGIPFFTPHRSKCRARPFAPSLDRKDAGGGYTKENVRVIAAVVNTMLMDWGDEIFEMVVNRYRANTQTRNARAMCSLFQEVGTANKNT